MKRLFASICILAFGSVEAFAVIGGSPAPELARHSVMILSKRGSLCSGAVISQNTILTAAHCVQDGSETAVHYRTLSGEPILLSPSKIVMHPNYVTDAIKKRIRSIDLAIIQLEKPLPAQFEPIMLSNETVSAGNSVLVGGYGLTNEKNPTSSGKFYSSPLSVIEPYGRSSILVWLKGDQIPQSNLKSGGCHADSGGPIFSGNKLVAITTWTTGPTGYECGDLTQGILIAPQAGWISKNIR